jgi:tRNA(Ile)-lysidine synthetase-like protein
VTELRALPRTRRQAALRAALEQVGCAPPSRAHQLALERLVMRDGAAEVHLPGGLVARRVGDEVRLGPPAGAGVALPDEVPVPVPGRLELPGWTVRTSLVAAGEEEATAPWRALLDPEAVAGLTVGRRRPGERIELAGMRGRRRVQDLLVDEKVPRGERDALPVFRTPRGVAWVAGLRVAAWARARGGPALLLEVERRSDARL